MSRNYNSQNTEEYVYSSKKDYSGEKCILDRVVVIS